MNPHAKQAEDQFAGDFWQGMPSLILFEPHGIETLFVRDELWSYNELSSSLPNGSVSYEYPSMACWDCCTQDSPLFYVGLSKKDVVHHFLDSKEMMGRINTAKGTCPICRKKGLLHSTVDMGLPVFLVNWTLHPRPE